MHIILCGMHWCIVLFDICKPLFFFSSFFKGLHKIVHKLLQINCIIKEYKACDSFNTYSKPYTNSEVMKWDLVNDTRIFQYSKGFYSMSLHNHVDKIRLHLS